MSLLKYCAEGNLTEIKKKLECCKGRLSAKVQIRDNHNWTCLHHAVKSGNVECVRYLLTIDELDTTVETFEGETALHIACTIPNASIEIVSLLIEANPDLLNFVNNDEVDLVKCAIIRGRLDIVQLLIANDAPVDKQDLDGDTALHIAAINIHLEVIRYLIYDTDCDVTIRNRNDKTACMILYAKLLEKLVHEIEPTIDEINCFEELLLRTYTLFDINNPDNNESSDLKKMINIGYMYEQPNSDLYARILPSFYVPPAKQYFFQIILDTNVYARHCLTVALLAKADANFEQLFEFWPSFLLELFRLFLANQSFFQEYIAEIMSGGWTCSLKSQVSHLCGFLSAFQTRIDAQKLFTFLKTMILYEIDFDILIRTCELLLSPTMIVTAFAPLAKFVMPYYPIVLRNPLGCDYNFNESENPLDDVDRQHGHDGPYEVISLRNLSRMSLRLHYFRTYSHHTALKALYTMPIPDTLRSFLCYNVYDLKF